MTSQNATLASPATSPATFATLARPQRPASGFEDQLKLARSILGGCPDALDWFQNHAKAKVTAFLRSAAWNDESRFLADEVADDLFSECFGGFLREPGMSSRPPLLESFHGRSALVTWLSRCALNRLRSRAKSKAVAGRVFPVASPNNERFIQELPDPGSPEPANAMPATSSCRSRDRNELTRITRQVVASVAKEHPLDFILVELHYIHGVPQYKLAHAWGVHPSTVNRKIASTLRLVRQRLECELRATPRRNGASPRMTTSLHYLDFIEAGCAALLSVHGAVGETDLGSLRS